MTACQRRNLHAWRMAHDPEYRRQEVRRQRAERKRAAIAADKQRQYAGRLRRLRREARAKGGAK